MADEETEDIVHVDNEPAFLNDEALAVDDVGEEDIALESGDDDGLGFSFGGGREFEE
ncbi:MAG: hypothetical protein AAB628_02930 [Patescibacteria group bacterium]